MKFKEMSWKELKKDFEEFLDGFTTEELIKSLRKYEVSNNSNYCFSVSTDNNLNENYGLNEIIIDKVNEKNDECIKDNKYKLEIKNNEYNEMGDAA